jgi:hypothetical protein
MIGAKIVQRGQGGRVPVPSLTELMKAAAEGREIVALSGLKHGPLAALTLSLLNGGTATVYMDELGAHILFESVKALFPNIGSSPASPVRITKTETGMEIQAGHMSG